MAEKIDYPGWLPRDLYNDFLAMRREVFPKVKNSALSQKRMINKLKKWRDIGYDIEYVLDYCTEAEWRGLWLPKGIEPKQTYPETENSIIDVVRPLKEKMSLKPDKDLQQKADEARLQAKKLLGLN